MILQEILKHHRVKILEMPYRLKEVRVSNKNETSE